MEKETKLRALCLLKILYELSDEDHALSTSELTEQLEQIYGLHVYRTTISSDIEQLRQFGIDIYTVKSTQNKYFLNERLFDIPELKLLIDAVESSKFITEKKSKELVEKIGSLASKNKADELKRNLCTEGRIKPGNEQIYYIVDALNSAINEKKKVSFQYYEYNVKKEKRLKHNGEPYIFSPYTLVWNGDYYYVIGFSDKHNKIVSFRVDRIFKQPQILKEQAVKAPDDFNEADYVQRMFHMFGGELQTVQIICDNSLMDSIIDRFGEDVKTYAYNLTSFIAEVDIAVSHIFYCWVFGFEGKVKIKSPESVKKEYERMVFCSYERVND